MERHQKTSTIVTSNRDPSEWIAVMSDPLLAQSAVDRLVSTSYELVIEGESYRRRQRPQPTNAEQRVALTNKENQVTINLTTPVVPSSWQPAGPITLASDTVTSLVEQALRESTGDAAEPRTGAAASQVIDQRIRGCRSTSTTVTRFTRRWTPTASGDLARQRLIYAFIHDAPNHDAYAAWLDGVRRTAGTSCYPRGAHGPYQDRHEPAACLPSSRHRR